ncbi:MAG: VCBS repeat-containing protein [Ilumatobacter sp.]|nr:VCBS repeat-containing protein [Ilumatobacter sp.]
MISSRTSARWAAPLAVSLALAATMVGRPDTSPTVEAAGITLTEAPGAPIRYPLNGYDLGFATNSNFSSPAVADVTGDGQPEIVTGGMNSLVRVYETATGRTITVDPGGANLQTGHGATQASPVIADVNRDGVDDVIVANTGGRLAAFSLKGGNPTTIFNRYVAPEFVGAIEGLFGTPTVAYVDGDGIPDVIASSWGQTVDVFRGTDGARLDHMHQWLRDTVWSSPVVGDITGDGTDSIVIGADCDGSGVPQPCYGNGHGGYVWAFRMDGSVRWSYYVRDAVVWSTPALADLNGDGALDVIVGTGLYFLGPAANKIMALDGKTGQPLWNAPTGGPVMGSPSVATVNGQTRIWVVSGGGMLMSFDRSGTLLWQQCVTDGACSAGAGTYGGVAIADIDHNGSLEAVVQGEQQMKIFDAITGSSRAVLRSSYPHTLFASMSTPTIAEVGGKTWIVQLNVGDKNGNLQTDGGDEMVVTIWTTGTSLGEAPWPTFKRNMARTGGDLPSAPKTVAPGDRVCFTVAGNPGDAAIVNLTPVGAAAGGDGLLLSSNVTNRPEASNVNFGPGTIDPNVAIAPIGNDGKVCYTNSTHTWVHLVADHLGTIAKNAYTPAKNDGTPLRKADTRL